MRKTRDEKRKNFNKHKNLTRKRLGKQKGNII